MQLFRRAEVIALHVPDGIFTLRFLQLIAEGAVSRLNAQCTCLQMYFNPNCA